MPLYGQSTSAHAMTAAARANAHDRFKKRRN
jgi:hypothetical protein